MTFAASQWLWALFALPVFFFFAVFWQRRRKKALSSFVSEKLWKDVIPEYDEKRILRRIILMTLGFFFLILALARPQWGMREETLTVSGLDLLVVLDVSYSMNVEDVVPSRLKKAKRVIQTITQRMQGDRVGVIAFARGAYLACPLTTDLEYVNEVLSTLSPETVTNQGTDVGLALEIALQALARAAEQTQGRETDAPISQAILLISDGEDLEQKALDGAQKVKETGVRLFVMGVGTEKGGPIPVRDDEGRLRFYKKDQSGQTVTSHFDPKSLMQVTGVAEGRYWTISSSEDEVDDLMNALEGVGRQEFGEKTYQVKKERFQIPLFLAILFFFWELSVSLRRKALAMLILGILLTGNASAGPLESYYENEKGIEAFKKGEVDEAKRRFGSALAQDPQSPELNFNQGVIQGNQGDTEGARRSFSYSADEATRKNQSELAARSYYNLGSVLEKAGQQEEAIHAFLKALDEAEKAKDPKLTEEIRKRLELEAQKPPQGGNQNQDQEGKDDQQQAGDSQDSDSKDQKDQKGEDGKKKDQKKYKETPKESRKKQFQSEKLSKEDAERVMRELQNRERQLQKKLNRQRGNPNRQGQDW